MASIKRSEWMEPEKQACNAKTSYFHNIRLLAMNAILTTADQALTLLKTMKDGDSYRYRQC